MRVRGVCVHGIQVCDRWRHKEQPTTVSPPPGRIRSASVVVVFFLSDSCKSCVAENAWRVPSRNPVGRDGTGTWRIGRRFVNSEEICKLRVSRSGGDGSMLSGKQTFHFSALGWLSLDAWLIDRLEIS